MNVAILVLKSFKQYRIHFSVLLLSSKANLQVDCCNALNLEDLKNIFTFFARNFVLMLYIKRIKLETNVLSI